MVLEKNQKKRYTAIVSVTKTSLINLINMSNKVLNLLFYIFKHIYLILKKILKFACTCQLKDRSY